LESGRPTRTSGIATSIHVTAAHRLRAFVAALGATLAAACGGASENVSSASAPASSAPSAAPSMADRVRVRTEKPKRDSIASFLETTSHVEAISEADVFARASGFDRTAVVTDIRAEEGDRVKVGQVLAVVDPTEPRIAAEQARLLHQEALKTLEDAKLAVDEADQKVELATKDAEQAKRDYERDRSLGESKDSGGLRVVAPRVLEASKLLWDRADNASRMASFTKRRAELALIAAQNDVEKSKLEWDLAKRRFDDAEVKAPIAGVISLRDVKVGETTTSGKRLFRITDVDHLQTSFYRPQRDLRLLGVGGQEVTATSEAVAETASNGGEPHVFRGKVERVAPVVDPASGAFKVTASLANQEGLLRPGLLVRVRVLLGRRADACLVPKRARVLEGEKPSVFVVREGRTVRVPIEEGFADSERIEVRNVGVDGGLRADDDVVVVANVDLREGLAVTPEGAAAGAGG